MLTWRLPPPWVLLDHLGSSGGKRCGCLSSDFRRPLSLRPSTPHRLQLGQLLRADHEVGIRKVGEQSGGLRAFKPVAVESHLHLQRLDLMVHELG